MTIQIISSNINASGPPAIDAGTSDLIIVQAGVVAASDGSFGINVRFADNVDIEVAGTVVSHGFFGIGGSYTTGESGTRVSVASTGLVASTTNDAMALYGGGNTIINDGRIIGSDDGIFLATSSFNYGSGTGIDGAANRVVNNGLILADSTSSGAAAIDLFGSTSGVATILNSAGGRIVNAAGNDAIYANSATQLSLTNRGLIDGDVTIDGISTFDQTIDTRGGEITGDIALAGGDDTIDMRNAVIGGEVSGGGGDDTYLVSSPDIVLSEDMGGGTDTVRALTSYRLADNFENLTLLGAEDLNGTGNKDANVIVGNIGDNLLLGGGSGDTLSGNDGDDRLNGGNGADTLNGGEGDDMLNGARGDDILRAGAGEDILYGADGRDILTGDFGSAGGDSDMFVYRSADESTLANADRILDFISGEDVLNLVRMDADTTTAGDQAFDFIGAAGFSGTAGELRADLAGANGRVEGDIDGDGTADFRIFFNNGAVLVEDDFML